MHRPVMLVEAINALNVKSDGIYVDCTFGRGGHSRAILQRLGIRGARVVCVERRVVRHRENAAVARVHHDR